MIEIRNDLVADRRGASVGGALTPLLKEGAREDLKAQRAELPKQKATG